MIFLMNMRIVCQVNIFMMTYLFYLDFISDTSVS